MSVNYLKLGDEKHLKGLRHCTRLCAMVVGVGGRKVREEDGAIGEMFGTGDHLRQDGHIGKYVEKKLLLPRKRKRGRGGDLASERELARQLLSVWEGACTVEACRVKGFSIGGVMLKGPNTYYTRVHQCTQLLSESAAVSWCTQPQF